MSKRKDSRLAKAGVSGYNKPKELQTSTKSHVVVAKEGDKIKTISFGQQGKKVGTLKVQQVNLKKESLLVMKAKRKVFKAQSC